MNTARYLSAWLAAATGTAPRDQAARRQVPEPDDGGPSAMRARSSHEHM